MANKHDSIRFERSVSRAWLIRRLEEIVAALANGSVAMETAREHLLLQPGPAIQVDLAAERKSKKASLCIKLSWRRASGESAVGEETDDVSADLRSAFREALEAGDFSAALRVGEEISRARPDSAAAAQFRTIRQVLEGRVAEERSAG